MSRPATMPASTCLENRTHASLVRRNDLTRPVNSSPASSRVPDSMLPSAYSSYEPSIASVTARAMALGARSFKARSHASVSDWTRRRASSAALFADSPTVAAHTASAFATAISATTETVSA